MASFDALKREAIQLERQMEDKVLRIQQVSHRSSHPLIEPPLTLEFLVDGLTDGATKSS